MSKVEALVACMGQVDDALYREMNLSSDAILANQGDEYRAETYVQPNGAVVKLISTTDRGVGRNRNKALEAATGEYLLCADQDMVYVDDYARIVEDAFRRAPDADVIAFNLEFLNRLTPGRKANAKFKRARLWRAMRYGAPNLALRRAAIDKACLSFSRLYGGGAKYSAGEDSLFIREALRKGLKMYCCPTVIARVKQTESTWFRGYTEKYYVDKGVLLANAFPLLKSLLIYYFAFGERRASREFGFFKICWLMRRGFREFKSL